MQAILNSPSYRRADNDSDFLARDGVRGVRLRGGRDGKQAESGNDRSYGGVTCNSDAVEGAAVSECSCYT